MTNDPFDPFDLPRSFDPLGSEAPPPPRRRRVGSAVGASARHGLESTAVGEAPDDTRVPTMPVGAGDRLAHLLLQTEPATPPKCCEVAAAPTGNGTDSVTRLAILEDQVVALTAQVEALRTTIDDKFASHQHRLLRAVATVLDERSRARR